MFKAFLVALFFKPIKLNTNPYLRNFCNLFLTSILILVIVGCNDNRLIRNVLTTENDSVSIWIAQSKDRTFSTEKRKLGLKKAFELSKIASNDSIRQEPCSIITTIN